MKADFFLHKIWLFSQIIDKKHKRFMHLIQSYRSLQNKNYTTFFSFKDDFFFIQSQPITAKSVHIHLLIYNTHTDINRTIYYYQYHACITHRVRVTSYM